MPIGKQKNPNRVPTTQRLADALRQAHAPEAMIKKAEKGAYDDYKSESINPIADLVRDAKQAGLTQIAQAAMDGIFDAAQWEAEEWAQSDDGQATFREFLG